MVRTVWLTCFAVRQVHMLTPPRREPSCTRKSKELSQTEIVNTESVIPHASFSDYVQVHCDRTISREALTTRETNRDRGFFAAVLTCLSISGSNGSSFCQSEVSRLAEDTLQIAFTLELRVFTTTHPVIYRIVLLPVVLEPIDVISSKLRDQEDEIAKLRTELAVAHEYVSKS